MFVTLSPKKKKEWFFTLFQRESKRVKKSINDAYVLIEYVKLMMSKFFDLKFVESENII